MDMVLYLRKETKTEWIGGYPVTMPAVAYYKDKEATNRVALDTSASRPTRAYKYCFYNCARYRIVWLEDQV